MYLKLIFVVMLVFNFKLFYKNVCKDYLLDSVFFKDFVFKMF